MLHLIAYDIANSRRLKKVASICEDFGFRIERSVFECDLEDEEYERFWARLATVLNLDCDSVVDYPIGLLDRKRIKSMGMIKRLVEDVLVF